MITKQKLPLDRRALVVAAAVFVVIALALIGGGYMYYRVETGEITREKYQTLSAIGELKCQQIQQWRDERLDEAARAANDSLLVKMVEDYLASPGDKNLRNQLAACLKREVANQEYANSLIFDTEANLLAANDDDWGTVTDATRKAMRGALATGRPVFSSLYRAPGGVVHIDIASPVHDADGKPLAVLVLRFAARDYLYPLIQSWPVPSRSAETLLVQRDGDEVLFLNDPRYLPGAALSLRIPLEKTMSSSVQLVRGKRGIFEGRDYRGISVVSDLLHIQGSPWFIEAKMDSEEILAEARDRAMLIFLAAGLFVLMCAGMIMAFYRNRQARILAKLLGAERQRTNAEEQAIQAERIAREKTALLKSIIESPQSIVIFALDRGYRYTEFTAAHQQTIKTIWGREIELGMNMLDIIGDPSDREKAKRNFDRVLNGEWLLLLEEYGDSPNRFCYENRYSPVLDAEGKVVGLTVFVIDVSERRRAEAQLVRSEQLLRESQETANIGHYIFDLTTGLWESSPVLDRLFGIGPDFARDADGWGNLLHPDDREMATAHLRHVLTNHEPFRRDYRIIRPSGGELRWMAGFGGLEYDEAGKPVRLVGCIQDITGRKQQEQLLEQQALALRQTNEDLKRSLKTAEDLAIQAQSATRAKSDFLAVMSHELRTPLNGVLGFTEILSATSLDNEQQDFVRIVRDSGEHLLGIVNDILDFSSIEKDRMLLEAHPVFISKVVDASAAAVLKTAADKGLEFRCETAPGVPEQITGDARRIRQILINLLGNAVKFTSTGSVVLRVAPAAGGGRKSLDFSIADTGIGIPPETLARLFKPFVQADSSLHRSFDGAGLGLAISLRLAEIMGGAITVASTPEKGSTFTFRLPLESKALPPGAPAAGVLPPAVPQAGGLVLVVEDDPMNSMLAGKFLKSIGMRVDFAANGLDAIALFAPEKYAAIFMDMQMPVINGMEATARIRGIEAVTGTRVPIIALTANVMPGDRERCLAAGMDDVLTKPFKKGEMAAKVARFAGNSAAAPPA